MGDVSILMICFHRLLYCDVNAVTQEMREKITELVKILLSIMLIKAKITSTAMYAEMIPHPALDTDACYTAVI